MNKYLKTLSTHWDKLASVNPMSSILVDNKKIHKDWLIDNFFSTGYSEMSDLVSTMSRNNISCKKHKAMDFGCGIGRLTQALAEEFDEVVGVDIAPTMIAIAKKHCSKNNCSFRINLSNDLKIFDCNSFDFIYSNIVFQHIRPSYTLNFIKEMLRIVKDDGLIVFQIPDRLNNSVLEFFNNWLSKSLLNKLYRFIMLRQDQPIEMYSIRKEKLEHQLTVLGGTIVYIEENRNAGPKWISYTYFVRKLNEVK